jgi:large subunit ribosomal protein L6
MSRLAKKSIQIPEKVTAEVSTGLFIVKGPLGELSIKISPKISIEKGDEGIKVSPVGKDTKAAALVGTFASHIMNMIEGVTKGFTKKLVIDGIGFKADVKPLDITLSLGFSHTIKMIIPEGIKVVGEKNTLIITGINKDLVGQFAAKIRSQRKPEPYKGKGIRYDTEVIRRKQGKKTV